MPKKKKLKTILIKENKSTPIIPPHSKWPLARIGKWIAFIFTFVSFLWIVFQVYDKLRPEKEKDAEKNTYTGELKPKKIIPSSVQGYSILEVPPVFSSIPINDSLPPVKGILIKNPHTDIWLMIGNTVLELESTVLTNGIEVSTPVFSSCANTKKISIILRDERIYVSVEFKTLLNEETAGVINFNQWKVYKSNILEYPKNDDDRLEVRDKHNNIIFTIKYVEAALGTNEVFINGYFISPTSISILVRDSIKIKQIDTCISKSNSNWKQDAEVLIQSIKTIF